VLAIAVALDVLTSAVASGQALDRPFDVGEHLRYRVSVAKFGNVGDGEMTVTGPVDVRGTSTIVLRSEIHARIGFVKTTERAESWVDPARMASLRYHRRVHGALVRDEDQRVELFPSDQRWEDQRGQSGSTPTTSPLDELSFIYYLRTLQLDAMTVDSVVRHYDQARNPVVVRVVGRDTIRTDAGTFATTIVEMRVKDPRRYGGEGVIRLHLSDDAAHYPVRIESSVPVLGATVLTLESYTPAPQRLAAHRE
jgi:hypothetical protein